MIMDEKKYFETLFGYSKNFINNFTKNTLDIQINKGLVICGMGGSAIAGDYIQTLAKENSEIPVIIYRGYNPPKFIDSDWTVIVISYSGNTEETLTCLNHFIQQKNTIYLISSGGKFEEKASKHNLSFIPVEKNLQPREAFYHIFGTLLSVVYKSLNLDLEINQIGPSIMSHNTELKNNIRDDLDLVCKNILGKQIMILGSENFFCVGLRFRCQLNENSKLHAACYQLPEFSHNAIIGYDGNYNQNIAMIILNYKFDNNRTKIHMDFANKLLEGKNNNYLRQFIIDSRHILVSLLTVTAELDYISIKLALIQNIDPHAIESINDLKYILKSSV
jgi:glucose/mannose-6-phosphate isomerase